MAVPKLVGLPDPLSEVSHSVMLGELGGASAPPPEGAEKKKKNLLNSATWAAKANGFTPGGV